MVEEGEFPAPVYYFDSSALVKRYMEEQGTALVTELCDDLHNIIAIAQIGLVEIAAGFGGKQRGGFITAEEYNRALEDLITDAERQYLQVAVVSPVIDRAIQLTQQHRLRGYDAVHLACALLLNHSLLDYELPPLTIVAADGDLLTAAEAEELKTLNPNEYQE